MFFCFTPAFSAWALWQKFRLKGNDFDQETVEGFADTFSFVRKDSTWFTPVSSYQTNRGQNLHVGLQRSHFSSFRSWQEVLAASCCVIGAELRFVVGASTDFMSCSCFFTLTVKSSSEWWWRTDDGGSAAASLFVFPLQVKVERLCDWMWIWIHLVRTVFLLSHSTLKGFASPHFTNTTDI